MRADLWLAWVGWLLLSSLWSLEPLYSLHVFWRRATMVVFFALAHSWWGPRERRAWVRGLLALAALFAAAWALGRWTGRWPDGLLPPNSNYTGCLLAAAAGAAFWAAAPADPPRRSRAALALLAAGLLLVMQGMRSRGALFAFACSAALWSVFHRSFKAPLAALAAALALLALSPAQDLLKFKDPLSYERPKLWATAVEIATKRPWLGVGPGCFEIAYFRERGPLPSGLARYERYTGHAHSEPLHLAAETGWLGLAFMIWALWLFLPAPRPASFESRAAQGAFWALLAHSFVDGVLALPALELLFFAALACAGDFSPPPFRFGPSRWKWMGPAGLALALFTWLPAQRAREGQAQAMAPGSPADAPGRVLDAAYGLLGAGPSQRERVRAQLASDPQGMGELRARFLKEALAVRPQDSFLHDDLALVYLSAGPSRPALALWELDRAIASNPTFARFQVQKAQLLLMAQDHQAARAAARAALALEPNFAFAALIWGEASLALGDRDQARQAWQALGRIRRTAAGLRLDSEYQRALVEVPDERCLRLGRALESGG